MPRSQTQRLIPTLLVPATFLLLLSCSAEKKSTIAVNQASPVDTAIAREQPPVVQTNSKAPRPEPGSLSTDADTQQPDEVAATILPTETTTTPSEPTAIAQVADTTTTTTIWDALKDRLTMPSCHGTPIICGPGRAKGRLWRTVHTSESPYRFDLEVSDDGSSWKKAPIALAPGAVQVSVPFVFRSNLFTFVSADDSQTNSITLVRSTDSGATWDTYGVLPIGPPDGWPNGVSSPYIACEFWMANVDSEGSVITTDAGASWHANGSYVNNPPRFDENDCADAQTFPNSDPTGSKTSQTK